MGSKKIKKLASTFDLGHQIGKKLGLPDPVGDALYGSSKALSPAEQAQKNAMDMAKQQAQQAEQAALSQLSAANEAASQSAMQMQATQERERLSAEVVDAGKLQQERPTIELASDVAPVTATRKKFRSQIGGTTGGTSVRV